MMKNGWMRRGLFGIPMGIALGYGITVAGSLWYGDGSFYPVRPELTALVQSEIGAVLVQTVLWGIVGGGFAMASLIWELDGWSFAKQSAVYCLLLSGIMFPVAYAAYWMPHSVGGVLCYVGVFVLLFVLGWSGQYLLWKRRVRQINAGVQKSRG